MVGRNRYFTDVAVTRPCPLCEALFVVRPKAPAAAFDKATGKPIAICPACTRVVHNVAEARQRKRERR